MGITLRKQTILLVDDVAENIDILRNILSEDYLLKIAIDGETALEVSRSEPAPDLILLDIMMPRMDGYEVCHRLKLDPVTSEIPVIFVTSMIEVNDEKLGFEYGAVDYITKPVSSSIVLARVSTHLALHNQNMALAQLNQEKNRFLGMAAHELRNPLGAISGFIELLLFGEHDEKTKKYLQKMYTSCNSMMDLINGFLDVSIIESGVLELDMVSVDIRALISDLLFHFELQAERKSITIKCSIDENLQESFKLDKGKIEQVINNLISNAIKYSHPETQVDVHVFQDKTTLYFEVKDQGQGILQDELETIFNPYQKTSVRTTAGEDSAGLGLTIVNRIVNVHGGEIKISSEVGVGTTFLIMLPIKV